MIDSLGITNFKSLKRLHLKPARLNLCFGLNGMGKSSLLQAMLLLRQSHQRGVLDSKGLLLQGGDLVSIGTGKDVFYQFAGKDERLAFEIRTPRRGGCRWSFTLDPESDILPLAEIEADADRHQAGMKDCGLFGQGFAYLCADRLGPQKLYPKSDFEISRNRSIGSRGEFAAHYLARFGMSEKIAFAGLHHPMANSDRLLHQTIGWLNDICPGARLVVEDVKGADLIKLGFQFETRGGFTNEFSPLNVGFGILYVLPVIVLLLRARPGDLVLVENPESHLHPKGQAAIGRLLAAAGANGVQIFCESHSDHIINGVRVAVKENLLAPEHLAVYYFGRTHHGQEHKTDVTEIRVDRHGELSDYPPGLLDEWSQLLAKLI